MEKFVIILKDDDQQNRTFNRVLFGKIVLGKVKVRDKVKIYNKSEFYPKDTLIVGISIGRKLVDDACTEKEVGVHFRHNVNNVCIATNSPELIRNKFTFETENNEETKKLLQQDRASACFPDLYNYSFFSGLEALKELPENKLQVTVEMIYPFYLKEDSVVVLKINGKSVNGKIVKILK